MAKYFMRRWPIHVAAVSSLMAANIAFAETFAAPVGSGSERSAAGATTSAVSDSALAERVKNALHDDAYFYDEHVDVKIENGTVVLKGFVFGDWDLRDAVRIAKSAAAGHKIINNLTIIQGGRR